MSADSKLVVGDPKKYDVRPKKVLCGEDYEDVSWISETQQLFCGFFSMHWCQSTSKIHIFIEALQQMLLSSLESQRAWQKTRQFSILPYDDLMHGKKKRENWEMLSILSNFRDTLIEMLPS